MKLIVRRKDIVVVKHTIIWLLIIYLGSILLALAVLPFYCILRLRKLILHRRKMSSIHREWADCQPVIKFGMKGFD